MLFEIELLVLARNFTSPLSISKIQTLLVVKNFAPFFARGAKAGRI